ncbi:hypothetical protein MBLNU459_g3175t2 [Dothideomycetes sp. NU459]
MPLLKNPILDGFNPDPSVVRVEDDFFMVTSTFEYFPGLPIYHSKDLINWELIGHALTRRSQFELRTAEPGSAGNWSDPVYFDQFGFDQDLFWDEDGRVYLSTCYKAADHDPNSHLKGFAVHVSEIDLATGRSLTPPVVVRKSPSGVAEGSHIIKRGSYYYLFTAEGGTESGHSEWVFRSQVGPLGPYETGPCNPLLSSTLQDEVQNTGHADLVEDAEGSWWAVALAVRPTRVENKTNASIKKWLPSPLGRETFLMKVTWGDDDWPIFNEGRKLQLSFESYQKPAPTTSDWRQDFSAQALPLGWYTKNTPLKQEYSLTERPGYLRLWGGPYSLNSHESPTMLLRKQTSVSGTWSTRLDFDPSSPNYEAGIVLYWNMYTLASIGIRKNKSRDREIHITQPGVGPGILKHNAYPLPLANSPVILHISCSASQYRLGVSIEADSEVEWLGSIPVEKMTADPPKGMAFTGMMLGLYAFGEMEPCLSPADFEYVKWIEDGQ